MGGGGTAAPIADNSEEFGVNEPKKDPLDDSAEDADVDASQNLATNTTSSSTSSSKKRAEPHHSATSPERSQLDQKFSKLDKDEVDISTSSTKGQEMDARAQRVADAVGKSKGAGEEVIKKHGGHADVEELHGKANGGKDGGDGSASGKKGGKDGGSGSGNGSAKKSGQDEKNGSGNNSSKGGKGGEEGEEISLGDKIQREQAKKFGVNLDD
jgi:hypothetical protein